MRTQVAWTQSKCLGVYQLLLVAGAVNCLLDSGGGCRFTGRSHQVACFRESSHWWGASPLSRFDRLERWFTTPSCDVVAYDIRSGLAIDSFFYYPLPNNAVTHIDFGLQRLWYGKVLQRTLGFSLGARLRCEFPISLGSMEGGPGG